MSPLVVMVGVIADSHRVHRTRTEFTNELQELGDGLDRELRELKSNELYKGRGPWARVPGDKRAEIITHLCDWLCERSHSLALAAIDLSKFDEAPLDDELDEWMTAALHIALQVQRAHQGHQRRKGTTFLVFDEHKRHADRLAELLYDPPAWTDAYYERGRRQEPLDQIIDSAFYARSHHVGLVQVADLFAFLFRRYSELHDFGHQPAYSDEVQKIDGWVETIASRLLDRSHRWPVRRRDEISSWFTDTAPGSLRSLGR